ncbi:bifunctional tetrahydrofolate synthase/dihydrofolate synthase [Legionella fairfieldensis]|uniref:bifunctional tetrahydrofolate synthase/dihydrofolate synthase n=1 Tax=Legionella fairfieldensis TaxID=45064 RepID=UPI00048EB8A6|nr:bifunctional tetrahydrofolate synthase/dihydrofolate synthase [Legionella fairfieldensis]
MKCYNNFSVSQWVDYLENRYLQEIQLGLSRIKQVAEALDLTHPKAKIITVAGTNGKGSTVASLEAIYLTAGYQVGSYTSPHLLTFNERIGINQQKITDEQLCGALSVIEEGRKTIPLTYFEMATLAALWHFKQHALDLIILEVGLGGRLDATNIIDADLAIITTIDFDHQAFLGDTKEKIGYEKAGIIRAGKPLIFADKNPPESVVNRARALNSPLYFKGDVYDYTVSEKTLKFVFQKKVINLPYPKLHCNSVAAAIMASFIMETELPVNQVHVQKAFKNRTLPGRLQFIAEPVRTLLDVAHNPQAAKYLAEFINNFPDKTTIHVVFSALSDKDIPALIEPLQKEGAYWYLAGLTGKRAATKEQLMATFNSNDKVSYYQNPLLAYQTACSRAGERDLIVVYGSFITVATVLQYLSERGYVDKSPVCSLSC